MLNRALLFVVPLVVAASVTLAVRQDETPESLLQQGRDLLASGKFADAALALARVAGDTVRDPTAKEAAVLRVHALVLAGKLDDAGSQAVDLLSAWPKDEPWRGRVEGLLAKAAMHGGRVADAVRREQSLAEAVISAGERGRVANVYFTWAARIAKGEPPPDAVRPGIPPDPANAIKAWRLGLDALGTRTGAAPALIRIARLHLELEQGAEAANAAQEALAALGDPLPQQDQATAMEARLLRARGLLLAGNVLESRATIRLLLAMPSVDETGHGPAGTIVLGETFAAEAGADAVTQALVAFGAFLSKWPDRPEAPAVRRRIAEVCIAAGAVEKAHAALREVVAAPKAPETDKAWARFQLAHVLHGFNRHDEARLVAQEFLANHPAHADVPAAQAYLPALLLDKARHLLKGGLRDEAIAVYREYVAQYPLSEHAPAISIEIGLELVRAGKHEAARDAFREARERYRSAKPDSAARAGLLLGIVEEENRRDLESAAVAYRAVADGFANTAAAAEAAARLSMLEGINLELTSPWVWSPAEAPWVELAVRNVSEVTLRVYRLDARSYFERKGSLTGTGSVDVALVKADHTFRFPVPDYVRYRRDTARVPVALGDKPLGVGTFLVTAEAENRRAVVLLIASQMQLVVKRSPTEVFAWATDTVSGAPMAGVDVLLCGADMKQSGRTAGDGCVRFAVEPGQTRVEVIGVVADSVVPGLEPDVPSPGREALAPRSHVMFDRPIYRPGDEVRFSAILRTVHAGAFVTPDGATVKASWLDPRGRTLAQSSHTTAAFGTVAGSFVVPADGAVGDYRLDLDLRGHVFSHTVAVKAYVKPEYRVVISPAARVVTPGDQVAVKLAVEAFFGGAVADAAFDWRAWRVPAAFDGSRYRDAAWFYHAADRTRDAQPEPSWEFVGGGSGVTDEAGPRRSRLRRRPPAARGATS